MPDHRWTCDIRLGRPWLVFDGPGERKLKAHVRKGRVTKDLFMALRQLGRPSPRHILEPWSLHVPIEHKGRPNRTTDGARFARFTRGHYDGGNFKERGHSVEVYFQRPVPKSLISKLRSHLKEVTS